MKTTPLICALAVATLVSARTARAEETLSKGPGRNMMVSATGVVAMPQADADDLVETSLGVGASLVYWLHPNVGVVGTFDYVFANTKEDRVPDDTSIYFYSINVGARFTPRDRTGTQPFGEITLGRHTAGYDTTGDADAQSDLGIRLGGGVTYRTESGFTFVTQLIYSTADIEGADINAFLFDLGVAWEL